MIALRKRGFITPQTLLRLHPLYVEGKVSTSADLIEQLTRQMSAEKLNAMSVEVAEANEKADLALAKLMAATRRAENAENVALEASYIVDDLESKNDALFGRVGELEAEIERYKTEQAAAARERSEATLSSPDTLVDVKENQIYRGSSCTILMFANGSTRHMKTSTFDPSGEVTTKAKSLKGRRVRTSCWDPVGQPGKWSSQGYFRNVYASE
jgi:cell division protein FtsB